MQFAINAMVVLAAVAFVLAVIGSAVFSGPIFGTPPEALSRASSNLALLAIASSICLNGKATLGGGS